MVDLGGLHARMRPELDEAFDEVMASSAFIRGKHVAEFEAQLNDTLQLEGHVVGCGNGTDALALALRALGLGPGDEVIVPDFSSSPRRKSWPRSAPRPCLQTSTQGLSARPPIRGACPFVEDQGGDGGAFVWPVRRHGRLGPWAQEHGLHLVEDNAQSLEPSGVVSASKAPRACLALWGQRVSSPAKTSVPLAMAVPC